MRANWQLIGILTLCSASALHGSVRALLVGINDYPPPHALTSPRRDVAAMDELLRDTYGVPDSAIHIIVDGEVTHDALKQAFRRYLIEAAGPDDTAVFFFSGHGSFIHDENGDEADGVDEVLVLSGVPAVPPVPAAMLLVDDELGIWLDQIQARQVLVILDSCHSGTGTRALAGTASKFFDLGYRIAATRGTGGSTTWSSVDKTETTTPLVALTASRADQISWASAADLSLFSGALVTWLRANPGATGEDFKTHLIPQVEKRSLFDYGRLQTPQLDGDWRSALNAKGDTPEPARSPSTVTITNGPITLPPSEQVPTDAGNGAVRVSLSTSQTRYRMSERMVVELTVSSTSFVQLYHTASDGEVQLIFPNAWQTDNRVSAGRLVRFPAKDAPYQFTVTPPTGTERITAYVSTTPLPEPPGTQRDSGGPFFSHEELRPASPHLRGLRVERADTVAPSIVTVSVEYYVEE